MRVTCVFGVMDYVNSKNKLNSELQVNSENIMEKILQIFS